jgi:hypothetical protein
MGPTPDEKSKECTQKRMQRQPQSRAKQAGKMGISRLQCKASHQAAPSAGLETHIADSLGQIGLQAGAVSVERAPALKLPAHVAQHVEHSSGGTCSGASRQGPAFQPPRQATMPHAKGGLVYADGPVDLDLRGAWPRPVAIASAGNGGGNFQRPAIDAGAAAAAACLGRLAQQLSAMQASEMSLIGSGPCCSRPGLLTDELRRGFAVLCQQIWLLPQAKSQLLLITA